MKKIEREAKLELCGFSSFEVSMCHIKPCYVAKILPKHVNTS